MGVYALNLGVYIRDKGIQKVYASNIALFFSSLLQSLLEGSQSAAHIRPTMCQILNGTTGPRGPFHLHFMSVYATNDHCGW